MIGRLAERKGEVFSQEDFGMLLSEGQFNNNNKYNGVIRKHHSPIC